MRKFINNLGNVFMKPLLKSPLHIFASSSIMLITFTGRKSGNVYTTPVQYRRVGNTVTFFTQKERTWWKNLRDRAPVTLRLRGQDVAGTVKQIITDENTVVAGLRRMYPRMTAEQASEMSKSTLMIEITI